MLENLTCYKCNNRFTADSADKECVCPKCGESISVSRAIKYDKSISAVKSEENKVPTTYNLETEDEATPAWVKLAASVAKTLN